MCPYGVCMATVLFCRHRRGTGGTGAGLRSVDTKQVIELCILFDIQYVNLTIKQKRSLKKDFFFLYVTVRQLYLQIK